MPAEGWVGDICHDRLAMRRISGYAPTVLARSADRVRGCMCQGDTVLEKEWVAIATLLFANCC